MIGTPNYPLLMASGLGVVIAALIGGAAVSGTLPVRSGAAAPAATKTCRTCGVVSEIRKRGLYDVTVKMDDGRLVTISQPQQPAMELGDRVRINGDVLVRG
jgi:outer membrane lipoprotein SlyB